MSKIVSVINYKGGVGKTTLTANLAGELAWRGYKVLMIDLDAQASLTFSFIRPDDWEKTYEENKTIKNWYEAHLDGKSFSLKDIIFSPDRVQRCIHNKKSKLDLIASHLGLLNVDLELATKLGGANLEQAKKSFLKIHSMLVEGLNQLDSKLYDIILIDCPPNFNIVTKTSIVASDYILVPARPDYLSTLGIDYLIRSVRILIKEYNEFAEIGTNNIYKEISPKLLYVVFNMIQEYRNKPIYAQRQYISEVKRNMERNNQIKIMTSYIKRNDSIFSRAHETGIPTVLNGYSNSSHVSVVGGLTDVTDEFCGGIGL